MTSDANARVLGRTRDVFEYVADFKNLESWYPGISNTVTTRGGKSLGIRTQYQMDQKIGNFKVKTLYEVVDMVQDKKIVYSVGSDLHTSTVQLVFMPDPNNPGFTMVRLMAHTELTEWRRALEPVMAGTFNKLPEQGLQSLTKLFSSANTPIRNAHMDAHAAKATAPKGWNFSAMFNSLKSEMRNDSPGSSGEWSAASASELEVDALGYYAALGLDGSKPRAVTAEAIKSAFRKAAQSLHPDKFSLADDEDRAEAEESFRKVQRAYEVLKDPVKRSIYDQGKLQQLEEAMSA
eukprot:CAMPEP_0202867794 /NCGR_PEP_ID=MMETSP1391-20130828/9626_1 /ASSEMBLY_ACC=CAM_ASM_000867 /TAXON_ID=1034604 /ORGANISM="Chlamydomonas leiostraca, Strain SAG 11-49" /LENGTH=291 /DNA_ID=CAMNT_0049547863 /DNA_START=188 /DNA_END=1063 /DNA_ORIENTATION=-